MLLLLLICHQVSIVHVNLQAVARLSMAPSTTVAAASAPVTITTGIPSPLTASTIYTYLLDKGDGTAVGNCVAYGSTDGSSAWTWASSPTVYPIATYSTDRVSPYTAVMSVYSSGCNAGATLVANTVPVSRATADITVGAIALQLLKVAALLPQNAQALALQTNRDDGCP